MTTSPIIEEYVKRVYQLDQECSRRVRTTELADAVDRTQASVTHMLQTLDEEGFVDIDQVPHHQSEVRDDLFENDVDPGSKLEIEEVAPVGLITITNNTTDRTVSMPDRVARQIKVRSVSTGSVQIS